MPWCVARTSPTSRGAPGSMSPKVRTNPSGMAPTRSAIRVVRDSRSSRAARACIRSLYHQRGSEMAIELPPTIERFIDASNARDLEAAVDCFAEEAVVEDEGRTHRGIVEVRAWSQATEERFRYTIEP